MSYNAYVIKGPFKAIREAFSEEVGENPQISQTFQWHRVSIPISNVGGKKKNKMKIRRKPSRININTVNAKPNIWDIRCFGINLHRLAWLFLGPCWL